MLVWAGGFLRFMNESRCFFLGGGGLEAFVCLEGICMEYRKEKKGRVIKYDMIV